MAMDVVCCGQENGNIINHFYLPELIMYRPAVVHNGMETVRWRTPNNLKSMIQY